MRMLGSAFSHISAQKQTDTDKQPETRFANHAYPATNYAYPRHDHNRQRENDPNQPTVVEYLIGGIHPYIIPHKIEGIAQYSSIGL